MRRNAGKVSVVQMCLIAAIGGAVYYGYVYGPVKLRYMGMERICDDTAHKMIVNMQDQSLIEEIQQRARDEQGVELSLSQVQIERQTVPRLLEVCRMQWDDKVQPFWQKTPTVVHQKVVETTTVDTNLLHEHDGK